MGHRRAVALTAIAFSLFAAAAPRAFAAAVVAQAVPGAPQDPCAPAPSSAGDANAADPNAGDPSAGDPSGGDPNGGDPNAGDPNAGDAAPPCDAPQPSDPLSPGLSDATPSPAVPTPQLPSHQKPTRARKHAILATPIRSGHTVPGAVAQLLPSGRAAAPADAPYAVKLIIWTANRLIGLPYRYGGGHGAFADTAYDCSGAVSYALHAADAIAYPEDSTLLAKWGLHGPGNWVTVYANRGHAWMIVAGLRLDTSPVDDPTGLDGPRWRPAARPTTGYRVRHPRGL